MMITVNVKLKKLFKLINVWLILSIMINKVTVRIRNIGLNILKVPRKITLVMKNQFIILDEINDNHATGQKQR